MLPVPYCWSCPAVCIAPTVPINCTLSPVPATGACRFSTPRAAVTALSILEQPHRKHQPESVTIILYPPQRSLDLHSITTMQSDFFLVFSPPAACTNVEQAAVDGKAALSAK